jgi:hypothetical protein
MILPRLTFQFEAGYAFKRRDDSRAESPSCRISPHAPSVGHVPESVLVMQEGRVQNELPAER